MSSDSPIYTGSQRANKNPMILVIKQKKIEANTIQSPSFLPTYKDLFISCLCVPDCMHVHAVPSGVRIERILDPWTLSYRQLWGVKRRCWELDPCPPQEQQELWTIESPLQPQIHFPHQVREQTECITPLDASSSAAQRVPIWPLGYACAARSSGTHL